MTDYSFPFVECLVEAMRGRGRMSNKAIYGAVKETCRENSRTLPDNWEAEIRQTLQAHCSSCPQYKGRADYFIHIGHGYWSCRLRRLNLADLED